MVVWKLCFMNKNFGFLNGQQISSLHSLNLRSNFSLSYNEVFTPLYKNGIKKTQKKSMETTKVQWFNHYKTEHKKHPKKQIFGFGVTGFRMITVY